MHITAPTTESGVGQKHAASFWDYQRYIRQAVIHHPHVRHDGANGTVDVASRAAFRDVDPVNGRVQVCVGIPILDSDVSLLCLAQEG